MKNGRNPHLGVNQKRFRRLDVRHNGGAGHHLVKSGRRSRWIIGIVHAEAQHLGHPVVKQAGVFKIACNMGINEASGGELGQSRVSVGIQNFGVTRRMDELQELGDELKFDQSATGALDVPEPGRTLLLHHQAAHVENVLAGHLGIPFGAQARGNGPRHFMGQPRVARHYAGPCQRKFLPGPGRVPLIVPEAAQTCSDGALAARWPQPHVHLEQHTFARGGGYGGDQPLGQAGEILIHADWLCTVGILDALFCHESDWSRQLF